jgi:ABC-type spermidine/putrescine transport system permease subunit II
MSATPAVAELRRPRERRSGRRLTRLGAVWLDALVGVITGATYIFLLAPIVVVVIFSLTKSATGYQWTGFTLDWYHQLTHETQLLHALRVSLVVGLAAAALSVLIGLLAAFAMARRQFRGKIAFTGMVLMPLVVPELVMATSLLIMWTKASLQLGYPSLVIGHVIITLPYAALIQLAGISGLNKEVEEAAADLGAAPRSVILLVIVPQLLPAMLTAFIFAFLVSFDDIVMSTFLSGVGTTMLPINIYSMLKLGVSPVVNALGTILVGLTLLLTVVTGLRQATVQIGRG